ncbi:hypothetical protein AB4Y42_43750 [Paraburkholderia sp. EG286B]|uniref:hypothetical protein n=1 Tax=Paraburkholderia sp. EG286B TaxID=3237011 RepID=UPI0034D375F6
MMDITLMPILAAVYDGHREPLTLQHLAVRFRVEFTFDLAWNIQPHSRLADQTPDEAYFATLPATKSAA